VNAATFTLREHQIAAVEAVLDGFAHRDRALVTMPCGTGKTAVAAEVARIVGGSVAVFVPTLALVRQSLVVLRHHLGDRLGEVVVVATESGLVDAGLTTRAASREADLIAATLSRFGRAGAVDLVVSTYHSAPVVAEAQRRSRGFSRFDLAVHDEAHRLAGNPDARFTAAHRDVASARHLFLTATPVTCDHGRPGWIPARGTVSMDDETVFGPRVFDLGLAEARARGLLCDWKVLVCAGGDGETGPVPALRAAAVEHHLSRIMVFTSRVRIAGRLAEALEAAGPLADGRNVRARVVHSQMTPTRRAGIVAELAEPAEDTVEIVCNVDCLTEGVDVAALDAVVFTSEKTSKVDVVQALGRVLRTAPSKQHGYVVVPVAVPTGGADIDVDGALRGGRFSCLWSILRSLREVDTDFAAQIDRHRALNPGGATNDLDKVRFDFDPELAARVETVAVETCTDTWWGWHRRLAETVAATGWSGLRRADAALDAWCGAQRRARVSGLLQADRAAALEELDGWWWVGGFTNVQEFVTRFADAAETAGAAALHPPTLHGECPVEVPGWGRHVGVLAAWVRLTRRRGLLPAPLTARFDRLPGWAWSVLDDDEARMVELLARYRAFEGGVDVPAGHVELGEPLGEAVVSWRLRYAAGTLPVALAHEIEAAGGSAWRWRRDQLAFEVFVELLERHVATVGHTYGIGDDPVDSPIGPFPLGRWATRVRHQHRRGTLDQQRVAVLDAVTGWSWSGVRPRERRPIGDRRHGTRSGYFAGCRCAECTRANLVYNRQLQARRAANEAPVMADADTVVPALRRLTEAGLSTRAISRLLGVSRTTLERLNQGRRRRVSPDTAAKLLSADAETLFARVVERAETDPFFASVRVPGGPTWARIEEMVTAGRTRTSIAQAAGLGRSIQLRRDWVTAENAGRIEREYRAWAAGAAGGSRAA